MRTMDDAAMAAAVREGDRRGFQVVVHAIGDAAADQTIRAFEAVCPGGRNPLRHGLVHGEVLSEALLDRMARTDIIALVQPVFMTHDIFFAENRLGPARARWTLAFAALANRGIRTAYGTDCPVESMDPLEGIACAVLRRPAAAFTGGIAAAPYFPEERVDLATAVDAYTLGGAVAAGEEDSLGRIRPGLLADLTLLDRDLFSIPPEDIPKARVRFTMVGGEFAFRGA
jgi:predicted amidohydrolase YtcJ